MKGLVPGLGMLPASVTTSDLSERARILTDAGMSSQQFGPGMPLAPRWIDPREPSTGQPAPRRSEFPVGVNLQLTQARHVPFSLLRAVADRIDVVRACIRTRKSHMIGLDWDVTLTRRAVNQVMLTDGLTRPGEAAQVARTRFEPEIARLRALMEQPDPLNDLEFPDWLDMLLEDLFVIDAVTVYPRRDLGGRVVALELIDGATIKPLLDYRGGVPSSPAPAFQQILHGFVRGEWTASGADDVARDYSTGEMLYRPRHRRTWSPYGMSETEQALAAADVWLKRFDWIREAFDSGAVPESWMKTDLGVGPGGLTPQQLLEYEAVLNASLSGQTEERHRLHLLPRGFDPAQQENFADKFQPTLDELLVKVVCMSFGVMPTEIGFPPSSGIGGKGHQEGEENSAYRKDIKPTVQWLSRLLTALMRRYLGCPPELEFTFIDYATSDQVEAEQAAELRGKGGRTTLNEERARMGLPLFDFVEADEPFLNTSAGIVFVRGALDRALTAPAGEVVPGSVSAADPVPGSSSGPAAGPEAPAPAPPGELAPVQVGDEVQVPVDVDGDGVPDGFIAVRQHLRRIPDKALAAEATSFVNFVAKRSGSGRRWRPFTFAAIGDDDAAVLNVLGRRGDLAAIGRYVEQLAGQ